MKLLGSTEGGLFFTRKRRGSAAVGAIVALGILALACSVMAVSARAGLSASATAERAIYASLAGEEAMERLLASSPSSLLSSGSGVLSQAYGVTRQWEASALPMGLVSLRVTVQWRDKRDHTLTLWTATAH